MPPSTTTLSNSGQTPRKRRCCAFEENPVTYSAPAGLYQPRSKIAIFPRNREGWMKRGTTRQGVIVERRGVTTAMSLCPRRAGDACHQPGKRRGWVAVDAREPGGLNAAMGMFTVRVRVANPSAPDRFFDDDFWVDTGALYSFMPEDRLAAIGLAPVQSREII